MEVKELTDDYISDVEPDVDSSDPNERKLARKLRIQRRLESLRKKQIIDWQEFDVESKSPIQQQIAKSYELMEKYLQQADEYITNVRIANDTREMDRREREGINRENILKKLEDDAKLAQEKFNDISEKWLEILNYNDPLLISEAIQQQQEAGLELVAQKDELIENLKQEIRQADRNFVLDQRKQNEDISTLSQRIEKQVTFMRNMYHQELENIENVMVSEREKLLKQARKRWDDLYKQRDLDELRSNEEREQALEQFYQNWDNLRIDFQETFRATKIKMEREIDELQKQLEIIKATTILNSEKLDYNYQILKKREDESIRIKLQQKAKINKLKSVTINLRKKSKEYKENSLHMIKKLEDEIKKLNVSIIEVEAKADHFASANDKKFQKVLELNKDEALSIFNRIQEIDEVLHVQQMGENWSPFRGDLKFHYYEELCKKYKNTSKQREDGICSRSSEEVSMALIGGNEKEASQCCKLVKQILTQVADRSGFLIEEKLKNILDPYLDLQKTVLNIDNIFEALGINNTNDVELLVNFFMPFAICTICNKQAEGTDQERTGKEEEDFDNKSLSLTEIEQKKCQKYKERIFESSSFECAERHILSISPENVLLALKKFVRAFYSESTQKLDIITNKRDTISRQLPVTEIKKFWSKYKEAFPKEKVQLWGALLVGLKKYHQLLKDRKELSVEVVYLRKQNQELTQILSNYFHQDKLLSPGYEINSNNSELISSAQIFTKL